MTADYTSLLFNQIEVQQKSETSVVWTHFSELNYTVPVVAG